MRWQKRLHICSLSVPLLHNRNSCPSRIAVNNWFELCYEFHMLFLRLSCKYFGFIISGGRTLTRCCVRLDKESICCLQNISSFLRFPWFRCLVPSFIRGTKSSLSLTLEKWYFWWNWSTGEETVGSNSVRLCFPGGITFFKVFFSPLSSADHILWFESNCTSDVTNRHWDWITAAAHLADVIWLASRDIHCSLCSNDSWAQWPHLLWDICEYFLLLSSLSLSFAHVYISLPCAPPFFLLPLSPALCISLFCWCSLILCLIADRLWCFDLSHGTDKSSGCVWVCVCVLVSIFTHTHINALFSPGLDISWFTTVWTANPIAFSLTDLHRTKTPQITPEWLIGFNIDHTSWLRVSKHMCRSDII